MSEPRRDRLYGLEFAEDLQFDPADVVEQWLCDHDADEPREFIIEEWSVHPPRYHLPSAQMLAEWVEEWATENGELGDGYEIGVPDEAADAFLDAIAATVEFRMANEKLRDLKVTPGDDPENPLLDGEPTWRLRDE